MSRFRRLRVGFAMVTAIAFLGVGLGVAVVPVHRQADHDVVSACIECVLGASTGTTNANAAQV